MRIGFSKKLVGCLLGILLAGTSLGQPVRRVELPAPASRGSIITLPLGAQGVVLLRKTDRRSYQLAKYSPDLEQDWSLVGQLPGELHYVASTFDGRGTLYLLFASYRLPVCQVVRVSVGPGFSISYPLNVAGGLQVTHFAMLGEGLFVAGLVDEKPVLYHTQLSARQLRRLPGGERGAAIQSLDVDTLQQQVSVTYTLSRGGSLNLLLHQFNESGQSVGQSVINPTPDFALLSGRQTVLNDSARLVVGSYGLREQSGSGIVAPQGLYLSWLSAGEPPRTSYLRFTELHHFFPFTNEREYLTRRAQHRISVGSGLRSHYRLLLHDIIQCANKRILIAEVLYPQFRSKNAYPYALTSWYGERYSPLSNYGLYNPYMWNPWYGSRGLSPQQVFDGYVYTHALIIAFDNSGKLLWDKRIGLSDRPSIDLQEKVQVIRQGENLLLWYSQKDQLCQTLIRPEGTTELRPPLALLPGEPHPALTEEVRFWYDRYFLSWGYLKQRKNRFFLQKIRF